MSKFPRYSPWRPDFEAPGPYVEIVPKKSVLYDTAVSGNSSDNDDDEDGGPAPYRYYESDKILGKLYRAIDERKIFQEIQTRVRMDGGLDSSTLMSAVWDNVKERCRLIQWEHKTEWARHIRDTYVLDMPSSMRHKVNRRL